MVEARRAIEEAIDVMKPTSLRSHNARCYYANVNPPLALMIKADDSIVTLALWEHAREICRMAPFKNLNKTSEWTYARPGKKKRTHA